MNGRIARTPNPPHTTVIFTSTRTDGDRGYAATAERMARLASAQPGLLGVESARDSVGITVSYWADDAAAAAWTRVAEHLAAQRQGQQRVWYSDYQVRVARVERAYGGPQTGGTTTRGRP
jgi:heme-degrading monooxygenase HmoA